MDFLQSFLATDLGKVLSSGAVVNFFLVIIGSLLGLLFKKGIPERIQQTLMTGMAFCVLYIGITGLFEAQANILVMIVCMALGSIIGEVIDLDKRVNNLGLRIENSFKKKDSNTKIAEGFVAATLLFCVGAMTIVGSIDSGINGDNTTLYSKSVIDCIAAVALTSSMGIGVIFAAASTLVIEGGLTLLAGVISPILSDYIIAQMSVIGSLLIIALALNMLRLTKIRVMNFVPAILLPLLLCIF
ncbi:MAG: DUF554 domain-containing protein, partial [Clostridia bacterium]|nr:DUF554 domain-containing protein [Clostridia bacterium]